MQGDKQKVGQETQASDGGAGEVNERQQYWLWVRMACIV